MLSGDNSILSRATQAKNETGTKQIQEKIRLAVAGAIANGNGSITEDLLKAELNKQFGENGYDLIDKEDDSWDVKVGEVVENVKKSGAITGGGAGEGNNTLVLTATDRATESRAAVIEVKVAGDVPTQEAWLTEYRTTNESEFNEMFAKSYGGPTARWETLSSQNGNKTADELYSQGPGNSPMFNNIYDLVIKQGYSNDLYISTYGATMTFNGESITAVTAEFVVTKNGKYTITGTKGTASGSVEADVTKCKIEKYTKTAVTADSGKNSKTVTAKDSTTTTVEVPAGFYYGDDENVGKVSTGFVITDSVDENGYSNGNEFVWIPITYTAASGSNAESIVVKNTSKPIATKTSGETENLPNYQGALYSDFLANSTPNLNYVQGTNNYREPAVISYDTGDYSSQGVTEALMQGDYNKMIQSIKTYGGFYVGRYEMGKGSNYSKIGVMPTSEDAGDENMWYGLYKKAKEYNKTSITAGMIWGSQYDAMLNFALSNGNDSSKITANTNGNHSGKLLKTGTWLGSNTTNPETDKINNIFDLEGNMFEWTKEAYGTYYRVNRGGSVYTGSSLSPSVRYYNYPYNTSNNIGSRLGLYIK